MANYKFLQNSPIVFCAVLATLSFISCTAHRVTSITDEKRSDYQNTTGEEGPELLSVINWRFKRLWSKKDSPSTLSENQDIPTDVDFLRRNDSFPTATWIGHSTLLLHIANTNILTDPHFSETASPVSWAGPKRVVASALSLKQLPPIDFVLISHNHYDHLDTASINFIYQHLGRDGKKTHFFVPQGLKDWFQDQGIDDVTELHWWQQASHNEWLIEATPVHHHSGRGLFDKNKSLWSGWSIRHNNFKFFFAGDTGYSPDFKLIGDKLGPFNLAAIPIGGYSPRSLMKSAHVSPEEAVQILQDIGAKKAIAIHWGTFSGLTDEPLDEPPKRLKQALLKNGIPIESFEVLRHGETRILSF